MRQTPFERLERMVAQMRREMWDLRERADERRVPFVGLVPFGAATDLSERGDELVLTVDMPGFEREEIDLSVEGRTLRVSAEHPAPEEWLRGRSFQERVRLPKPVDEDAIVATYRNGVLEVHLPVRGAADGHRIDIE